MTERPGTRILADGTRYIPAGPETTRLTPAEAQKRQIKAAALLGPIATTTVEAAPTGKLTPEEVVEGQEVLLRPIF